MLMRDADILPLLMMGCWLTLTLVVLLLVVLQQLACQKALAACTRRHRSMEPALVWLNMIPVFHLFWKYYTAVQVGNSLRQEFDSRGMRTGHSFGKVTGVMAPTVALVVRGLFVLANLFGGWVREEEVALLVVLVTGVIAVLEPIFVGVHWSQVAGFTRKLTATRPAEDADEPDRKADADGGEREFDDDYRPRTRRREV
jgi:hypothetical protein